MTGGGWINELLVHLFILFFVRRNLFLLFQFFVLEVKLTLEGELFRLQSFPDFTINLIN